MKNNIFSEHHNFWDKKKKKSLYLGIVLLFLSLVIQRRFGHYAAKSATNFVGDLLLDNLPLINLSFVIVQGAVIAVIIGMFLLSTKPRYLLFSLKAISLFIITRALFLSLTHTGIYPNKLTLNSDIGSSLYGFFDFQANFFFSGHTGLPFLMALIFWTEKFWRRFFIGVSIFFGASVLLAHVHYSIDVFAAPFITYTIYKIAEKIFNSDYKLMPERKL